jgi:hypothetical protein
MKKLLWFSSIVLILILGFLLIKKTSEASVEYHYRYQILTQGKIYEAGQDLEIKLYINVQSEQVNQANVTINYDPNLLQLKEIKKWDIFEINTDTSTNGTIKINGTTQYQFSGEAPVAYLYFKTLQKIDDLTQILTADGTQIAQIQTDEPTEIPEPTAGPTVIPTQPPGLLPTSSQETPEEYPNCPKIEGDGSLALIIIPDHYTDLAEFETDAKQAVAGLKETNLPSSVISKFSFYYSSDLSKDYGVSIDGQSANLNVSLVKSTQQDCQGDAALIISKKYPDVNSSFGTGGFSMISSLMAVVFKHSVIVTPHELGHALPGLFDEYSFNTNSIEPANYYNCSGTDQERCREWQEKYSDDSNVGCYSVCGYSDWFRPTQYSTMNNNLDYINYYNPPSIEAWEKFMEKY